jgi:phage gp36-like protein
MAYCTLDDLVDALSRDKLAELTDDENLGDVFLGRITKAIESADTLIDSYLRGKFTLPLVSPAVDLLNRLRQLSTDFAIWYLYQRRRGLDMPEKFSDQYDRNSAYLKDVAAGRVLLDAPTAVPNTGGTFKSNKNSASREFTAERLGTY